MNQPALLHERHTAIPVGRGTWANPCARPLAWAWCFAIARSCKARAKELPF